MAQYHLTPEERELIIRTSDASDFFDVLTLSETWKRRFESRGYSFQKDHQGGWSCKIPISEFRGFRRKRQLSQEQRLRLTNALAAGRAKKSTLNEL